MKLWVLTGDGRETVKNISFSCKILTEEMVAHSLTEVKTSKIKEELEQAI